MFIRVSPTYYVNYPKHGKSRWFFTIPATMLLGEGRGKEGRGGRRGERGEVSMQATLVSNAVCCIDYYNKWYSLRLHHATSHLNMIFVIFSHWPWCLLFFLVVTIVIQIKPTIIQTKQILKTIAIPRNRRHCGYVKVENSRINFKKSRKYSFLHTFFSFGLPVARYGFPVAVSGSWLRLGFLW